MHKTLQTSLVTILASFLLCGLSKAADYVGVWGGKWDDKFPVFLAISKLDADHYKIVYSWLENTDDKKFSVSSGKGKTEGNHLSASFLFLRVDGDKAMLYGTFDRMANMVKIKSADVPTTENADAYLRENGWKEGVIPAEEAKKKVLAD